jgi:hypothetical protein
MIKPIASLFLIILLLVAIEQHKISFDLILDLDYSSSISKDINALGLDNFGLAWSSLVYSNSILVVAF